MLQAGIKIKTFIGAGRYQHITTEFGTSPTNRECYEISNAVVEMQKQVNEKLWEEIPEGSGMITSVIKYKLPNKAMRRELEQQGRTLDIGCGMT